VAWGQALADIIRKRAQNLITRCVSIDTRDLFETLHPATENGEGALATRGALDFLGHLPGKVVFIVRIRERIDERGRSTGKVAAGGRVLAQPDAATDMQFGEQFALRSSFNDVFVCSG
jgi:hypothetical protein